MILAFGSFDWLGFVMGAGLSMVAWNEFRGRKLLRQFQTRAAALLYGLTAPVLRPLQRVIPTVSGLDLTPISFSLVGVLLAWDATFGAGTRFAHLTPHPYWAIVLLATFPAIFAMPRSPLDTGRSKTAAAK